MMLRSFTAALLAAASGAVSLGAQAGATDWVGEFRVGASAEPVMVHLRGDSASVDLPMLGRFGAPAELHRSGAALRLTLAGGPDTLRFSGVAGPDSVAGAVTRGAEHGSFTLVRMAGDDLALNHEYAGSYELAPGRVVDLGPFDEPGGRLVYLDHKTLNERLLIPLSSTRFAAGHTLASPYPFAVEVEFTRDAAGRVNGLVWREGRDTLRARRLPRGAEQSVEVRNGDVVLRGTLTLPAGSGPHPAVVFAHGSGNATRNLAFWNQFFARLGFAVLSLDKRGAGESTGDWHSASMDDLAGDWLAGIDYLQSRPDIDPRRIGVHASSQGGWTSPRMAARSSDVAFLIVRAGPGVSVADAVVHENEGNLRGAGFSDADVQDARRVSRQVMELMMAGAPWARIDSVAAPWRGKPWADMVWPVNASERGYSREWWRLNGAYDPIPSLRQVRVPVLWFLAERDWNLPTPESEARLRAVFRESGHPDATVVVLPGADHGFLANPRGFGSEFPTLKGMVPGYWDTMEAWLRQRFPTAASH